MKRTLLFIVCVLTSITILAQKENSPEVIDIEDSGCMNKTRSDNQSRVLVLTKEDNIISCELQGYYANCGVRSFDIESDYLRGKDAPDSLFVDIRPVIPAEMNCTCPYTVYFTIRNVTADSFFLYCWLYSGMVSFKESNQVTLEISTERVTIDGSQYDLYKPGRQAMLYMMEQTGKSELRIPSTIRYEGQDYTVSSILPESLFGKETTKLILPKTLRRYGEDNAEFRNNYDLAFPKLEEIEVEPGCHLFSSVDGVLYSGDGKSLYWLPVSKKLTSYTVIDGAERIGNYAFWGCDNLQSIRIPESVTSVGSSAFAHCKNLESIYILGKLDQAGTGRAIFDFMTSTPIIYVQESEVEYLKSIYKGTVLPLPESDTNDSEYIPFVESGKVWKVGDYSGNPVRRVEYYYFDGDTIIDGKTCKQMMCQRYVAPDHPDYAIISQYPSLSYVGAWYEEDKKVYEYNTTDKQFKLMYDFSVDDNATLQIHGQSYVIGPKQTGGIKGFKGVYRDVMWGGGELYNTYNTTWLEGVGCIDGPIASVYLGEEGHAIFLMSCTVGDEVIYLDDGCEDGATPAEARKHRFDFTHTVKTQPKARNRSGADADQSIYGEYNDLQLGINLDPLDDAYQVRITDEFGKTVYEKAIDAGNIVALNIDISSYAKGRYTVTVENSYEFFTGEFGTQTAGIEEVRSKRLEVRSHIYNLQGQRLSSLQRGLNIINGQKVYVK
jgi:hypothetical protein